MKEFTVSSNVIDRNGKGSEMSTTPKTNQDEFSHNLQSKHSTSSFSSSDTEEFSSNMHNIDHAIYKNCKRSNLKIIFMNKNDLRKSRNNQGSSSSLNCSQKDFSQNNNRKTAKQLNQNIFINSQPSNCFVSSKKLYFILLTAFILVNDLIGHILN